jgi:hypothetical protein
MGNLFRIGGSNAGIGVASTYRAVTIGQAFTAGIDQVFTPKGLALKPFSPVYLKGVFDVGTGDLDISWIRRDRFGLTLRSGVDIVMSEATETYQIDIVNGAASPPGVVRTLSVTGSRSVTYTAAQQATDFGSAQSSYDVLVYQMSAVVGRGYPVEGTIP